MMEAAAHSRDFRESFDVDAELADEREFIEIYRDHFGFVYATLRRLGVDEVQLDDAAQDVFVVVHRKLLDFEYRCEIRTWLFAIARRVAYRQWRTDHRVARKHDALAHQPVFQAELDDVILRREGRALLLAFLDQLDEQKREAFILGELEEMGRREMGEALGVSPNTAYSRLRAARQQFETTFASPQARASLVAQVRERDDEAQQAQHRVWAILAPGLIEDVGIASTGFGTSALIANVKVFAITVLTGTLGLIGVDAALPLARAEPVAAKLVQQEAAPASQHRSDAVPPSVVPSPPAPSVDEPVEPKPQPSAPRKPSAVTSADDVAAENALIQSAHAHLRAGDAGAALEPLRVHVSRHPAGVLAAERELLLVEALCVRGDTTEATTHANALLAANPTSPARARIESSCALIKTE